MTKNCKLPQPCVTDDAETSNSAAQPTPAFSVCVGDWTLQWDGTHLTQVRNKVTPDGTYGSITLQDGCVVAYGDCEVPVYTPPYCNPSPVPCSEVTGSGAGSTAVSVSPRADNQLRQDVTGLYAKTYLSGGTGVSVTGTGTASSPYVVALASNAEGGSDGGTIVGQGAIEGVTRNGVTYVSLKTNGVEAGKYGPLTIDRYGLVTGIDEGAVFLTSKNLSTSRELTLTGVDGAELSLAESPAAGVLNLGGYRVTVSQGGRVIDASREVNIAGGTYKLGAYNVTIDNFGSISSIEQSNVPNGAGTFTALDGRVITYDDTGRITSVSGTAQDVTAQGPIMDVWVLKHSTGGGTVDGEWQGVGGKQLNSYWGNDLNHFILNKDGYPHTAEIQLPAYITRAEQVEIHRNNAHIREERLDLANKTLTLAFHPLPRNSGLAVRNEVNIVLRG